MNCHKFAHMLSLNACTWQELVDKTFCGQSINWPDLSRNGHNLVTDDWHDEFPTFITQVITANIVMWVNMAQHCRSVLFQNSDFAGDLEDSKPTFVPISWMCKKRTSVSHSSTESEIISLDAGSRMEGLPALELWNLAKRLKNSPSQSKHARGKPCASSKNTPKIGQVSSANVDPSSTDQVPSNAHLSEKKSQLYSFEDNEAVIKMIIKGRSPTMRHVSGTHRVALDWLLDRINLDPKIQIKYLESNNQIADIETKGSFTRDEWNHLLHLFDITSNTTFTPQPFFCSKSEAKRCHVKDVTRMFLEG